MTHRASSCPQLRRPLAGALFASLAASLLFAAAASAGATVSETPPDPPVLHFAASGEHAFSSGRITVDARPADGATLTVTLTAPSGTRQTLSMAREGNRHSWTGHLTEAGTWRADAVVEGPGGAGNGAGAASASATASVSLAAGAPSCSVSVSAPKTPTPYLDAEIVINTCDATAVTGEIATRYARVLQDGVEVSSLDSSDACERRFILPGGGDYEAVLEVVDDRGVSGSCSSPGLDVAARYPRYWLTTDLAAGLWRSTRPDILNGPRSEAVGGASAGIVLPHNPDGDRTTAFSARVAGGFGHNYWVGSSVDFGVTRQTPTGFIGAGAGVWGLGDSDLLDGAIIGTGGLNLPSYTRAGQVQAFVELRLFARHITDFTKNYASVFGLRFNFRPVHKIHAR